MIDENKLVKELESWADRLDSGYAEDIFKLCLTMVAKKIKDEYSKTCVWTPVSEDLPEKSVFVLVSGEDIREDDVVSIGRLLEEGFATDVKVKAWMNLPDPYKEKKAEDWKASMLQNFMKVE